TYLSGLPGCTPEQQSTIDTQTADPLTLSCRPSNYDPAAEGAAVTEQIATSTQFLNDPVITAQTINPDGTTDSQPYYQKLSSLPQAYRVGTKVPWAAAVVAVLSAVGVFFLAAQRRRGIKIITIILAIDGLILVSTKFASDQAFNSLERHIFNAASVGQLQKALTTFFGLVEDQLIKVDLWFGLAYIGLAVISLVALLASRQRGINMSSSLLAGPSATKPKPAAPSRPTRPAKPTATSPKPAAKKPRPPRPPRLVQ
ncbi:MAG TPA: hypothetical protein VM535_00730, partial [Candidatus Saccharimonadales bacterium]|nr:hypothetical protein [Candidatus Saccharimonadales bacterium]